MNVVTGRPRIFLSSDRLAVLRQRAAAGTSRWRTLKALVDRPGQDWDVNIPNYALAYQVTEDVTYARKAITLMQQSMAAGLSQVTGDSGYYCRSYFPAASFCLDWCWDAMTQAERAALILDMETCANWVWPETNPFRANAWSINDPGNNYFHGFMTTWIAALALSGSSGHAAPLLSLCQDKWDRLVVPYLAGEAAGGFFIEGTSYGVDSVEMMLFYRLALATATDLPDPLAGWPSQAVDLLIQLTTPAMDRLPPLGDQTKSSGGSLRDPARIIQVLAAGEMKKPTSQFWADQAVPAAMQDRMNAAWEFLWYPEGAPPEDYRKTWPVMSWAKGSSLVTTRSDWTPKATQVVIEAGPVEQSHQDRASGCFGLFAGSDWLAAWAKITSHSGIAQETSDSNCVEIGGQRQTWTQDQAKLILLEEHPLYTYARADLLGAYTDQCQGFWREYLFFRPGLLLVRDTIDSPTKSPVFSLHTGGLLPTVSGSAYHVEGRGSRLWGTALVPASGTFAVVTLTNDRDPGQAGWRLDLPGTGAFLVSLECAPLNQSFPIWDPFPSMGGVRGGGNVIAWPNGPLPWTYLSPGSGKHLLLGLEPGTYQVNGKPVTTTAQGGILMFDGPPAGAQVTVTVADGGGGGGGGDLTNRTWNIVSGTLITSTGQNITLTGGHIVVQAIPGDAPPTPVK